MSETIEMTIHNVDLKECVKLLNIAYESTEWERENMYYISLRLRIKNLELSIFSTEYNHKLGLTKESKTTKDIEEETPKEKKGKEEIPF